MEANRGGQSLGIHYNSSLPLDYMWNIKSFNYLNYSYICGKGSSLKPSVSVAKLLVKNAHNLNAVREP